MRFLLKLLSIGLFCGLAFGGENKISDNYIPYVVSKNVDSYQHDSILMVIGQNIKKPTYYIFEYNIASSDVIVGDISKIKWGIDCAEKKDDKGNSCYITDDTERQDSYHSFNYTYKDINMFAKATMDLMIDTEGREELKGRYVDGGDEWNLAGMGVVGLSPQGNYGKYIRGLYDNDQSILLNYKLKNNGKDNSELKFDSHVVLNPKLVYENVLVDSFLKDEEEYWGFDSDVVIEKTDYKEINTSVCLSSTANELMLLKDPTSLCDTIKKNICDGKTGEDCKKQNSDFSKTGSLKLTVGEKILSFEPEEYLFYGKNKVVGCRFGDIADLTKNNECASYSKIGFGRLFFAKYSTVFRFNLDNSSQLIVMNDYSVPDNGNTVYKITKIVCIGMAVVFFILAMLNKKKVTEDEYNKVSS